jgi:MAF protein
VKVPGLVLASNSPRRRELLALGGWSFQVRPADVDESQLPGEAPADYVLRLAQSKARACASSIPPDLIIVGADTSVVTGPDVLGKPKDPAKALEMLRSLRGHSHLVLSGIAVLRPSDGTLVTDLCTTEVPMRAYGDDEIAAYVATGDPLDKAGAYAIQHPGFHPVETLHGCYASVMGLPLCHLARSLRKLGILSGKDVACECQSTLRYGCPIFSAVLRGDMAG